MAIVNGNQFSNASTAYREMFAEVFQGDTLGANNYLKYCALDSRKGLNYEWDALSAFPYLREFTGPRQLKSLRANSFRIPTKEYEASVSVTHIEYDQQPELVAARLKQFIGNQRGQINKLVVDKLVAGNVDLGYDNVPFFSTAHVNDDGSTLQSNYSTNTLTLLNYRSAKATMMAYTDSTGERPLGVVPKKIIVGPALFDRARDILNAKFRTQGITAGNVVDAATIVAAAAIDNVVSDDGVEIIMEPMLTGDAAYYWFLVGEVADGKPMIVNTAKPLEPKDDTMIPNNNASYTFAIEGQFNIGYGLWQTAFGSFATT